jgi:exonuclease III
MHIANNGAPKYKMGIQIDTEGKKTITQELQLPTLSKGRSSSKKINKETGNLNCTLNQMDLTDICRTSVQHSAEYTLFSTAMKHFPEYITF